MTTDRRVVKQSLDKKSIVDMQSDGHKKAIVEPNSHH
jgi:hypothetical protein